MQVKLEKYWKICKAIKYGSEWKTASHEGTNENGNFLETIWAVNMMEWMSRQLVKIKEIPVVNYLNPLHVAKRTRRRRGWKPFPFSFLFSLSLYLSFLFVYPWIDVLSFFTFFFSMLLGIWILIVSLIFLFVHESRDSLLLFYLHPEVAKISIIV